MSLTFYYTPQSNATRVRTSLEELGVPFETVKVDLRAGDQKKPAFLALNPNGKVPTIVLDGTPMFESVAIQIALGERYGVAKGLWPALESGAHLEALTWLVWAQVSLGGALARYMMNTHDWIPKEQHNAAQAEVALKEGKHLLGILDARLKEREWIVGDSFTLVDVDVASVLGWILSVAKIDTAEYPNLKRWFERCTARPSFKVEG